MCKAILVMACHFCATHGRRLQPAVEYVQASRSADIQEAAQPANTVNRFPAIEKRHTEVRASSDHVKPIRSIDSLEAAQPTNSINTSLLISKEHTEVRALSDHVQTNRSIVIQEALEAADVNSSHLPAKGRAEGGLNLVMDTALASVFTALNGWFKTFPYSSAFCIAALKATLSDIITQIHEGKGIVWQRTLAFLLYGGLYQGCVQYLIYNTCFSTWFGSGEDLRTVVVKVCFDQFVHSPFLALPVAYMFKAVVFNYPLRKGLERYIFDARRDLLVTCWIFWIPIQFATFGIIPQHWRITFIALASFFWLMALSRISSRHDAVTVSRS